MRNFSFISAQIRAALRVHPFLIDMLPDEIKNFIKIFSALPSIGIRQATRLAFHLINTGRNNIEETAKAISDLRYIKTCSRCFFVYARNVSSVDARGNANARAVRKDDLGLCDICRKPDRNPRLIAIVEKETDLISIEKIGSFKGRYLILGELKRSGVLEPNQKLRLNHLKTLIKKELGNPPAGLGQADEIILALNPTSYGDLNALIIAKELEGFAKKITRLGRGIPTGGEIEFADDDTLKSALERRG